MSPAANGQTPETIGVRMYQVGFGDCFLLSFGYEKKLEDDRAERHILIDFGSTHKPDVESPPTYEEIATSIAERTGGKLDAIVVTHRHKDHLSGFGDDKAGAIIAGLKPSAVIRPWTENPKLANNATAPADLGERSLALCQGLKAAMGFAEDVSGTLREKSDLRGQVASFAAQQVPNAAAIKCLDELAEAAGPGGRYLHAGEDSGLGQLLPGVDVTVLGPPTPDEWSQVTKQREDDPEYWLSFAANPDPMLAALERAGTDGNAVVAAAGDTPPPGQARLLVERMQEQAARSLLRIVRTLDDALNNTSVILLFDVGSRRLLFPGDAQIENWSFSLGDKEGLGAGLGKVDLYKVGHHGSRNATPRSLVERWESEGDGLTSLMSTMPEVHGESEATAVPRATLIDALEQLGPLERTDSLPEDALFLELTGSTGDSEQFSARHGS